MTLLCEEDLKMNFYLVRSTLLWTCSQRYLSYMLWDTPDQNWLRPQTRYQTVSFFSCMLKSTFFVCTLYISYTSMTQFLSGFLVAYLQYPGLFKIFHIFFLLLWQLRTLFVIFHLQKTITWSVILKCITPLIVSLTYQPPKEGQ